ncbi:MAG TPA: hypothetical protein VN668_05930 [Stellaceae bacterium]|nr:hypothetical protein [Stellaceae bacterium]
MTGIARIVLLLALPLMLAVPARAAPVTLVCHGGEPPDDVIELDAGNGVARFVQNIFIAGQTRPVSVDDSAIVIQFAPNTRWVINRATGVLVVYDLFNGAWQPRGAGMKGVDTICRRATGDLLR